jgi:transcriptional regulator with XRE-family HTH domain
MRFRNDHPRHYRWQGIGAFLRHPRDTAVISLRRICAREIENAREDVTGERIKIELSLRSHSPTKPKELGTFLRRVRRTQGHSLNFVSEQTRIQRSYIQAIERGDFGSLPGGLFNKSFVRIYAKELGIREERLNRFYEPVSDQIVSPELTIPRASTAQATETQRRPPKFAEYLLYFFLTKSERINLIGDTEEEYSEVLKKFGRRKADVWFYKQVFDSLRPLIRRSIAKAGLVIWVVRNAGRGVEFLQRLYNKL